MRYKVFISHASEDKERFVIDFTQKLFESGIDAWLDIWEMLPGDSLVGKIFDEGIKSKGLTVRKAICCISCTNIAYFIHFHNL